MLSGATVSIIVPALSRIFGAIAKAIQLDLKNSQEMNVNKFYKGNIFS